MTEEERLAEAKAKEKEQLKLAAEAESAQNDTAASSDSKTGASNSKAKSNKKKGKQNKGQAAPQIPIAVHVEYLRELQVTTSCRCRLLLSLCNVCLYFYRPWPTGKAFPTCWCRMLDALRFPLVRSRCSDWGQCWSSLQSQLSLDLSVVIAYSLTVF